jgi:hypothetical protein
MSVQRRHFLLVGTLTAAAATAALGQTASYAGDWVTRSIRRRGEPTFR